MTAAKGPTPGEQGNPLATLLGGGVKSTRLGVIMLAGIVVTVVLLAMTIWPWIQLRTSPPAPVPERAQTDELEKQFQTAMDGYVDQTIGRAPFHLPGPSRPKAVVHDEPTNKPSRYGGPSISAMINNQVWFSDGTRLGPADPAKGDIKVVSLNAPWSAKIRWQGADFDVEFFQRSPLLTGGKLLPEPDGPGAHTSGSTLSPSNFTRPRAQEQREASVRGAGGVSGRGGDSPVEGEIHILPPAPPDDSPAPSMPAGAPGPAHPPSPAPAPSPEPANPEPSNQPSTPPANPPSEPESK